MKKSKANKRQQPKKEVEFSVYMEEDYVIVNYLLKIQKKCLVHLLYPQ